MSLWQIIRRSLRHYRRTNLFIILGIMVATAVITGSLSVGDSLQASLRGSVLARLGHIDDILITTHFFPATLADRFGVTPNLAGKTQFAAAIFTLGGARPADAPATVLSRATVLGIDPAYWAILQTNIPLMNDQAAINRELANDLHLAVGQELLVTIDRGGVVTDEVLFAHRKRDETLRTLRVTIAAIVDDDQGGSFGLEAGALGATAPRNIFLPRETLAAAMEQPGKANLLLAAKTAAGKNLTTNDLQQSLHEIATLPDLGLTLIPSDTAHALTLESGSLLLTDDQVAAASQAAAGAHATAAATSAYLATQLTNANGKQIAYAIVGNVPAGIPWTLAAGTDQNLGSNKLILNRWAADDLHAKIGDSLQLTYLAPTPQGDYHEMTLPFALAGIVELTGPAADPHLTPSLNGLTNAKHIDEWKLPFPVDHQKLTPRDDEYWDKFGPTPKIFVSAETMQKIWATATGLHETGWATGVRMTPPAGVSLADFEKNITAALAQKWSPEKNQMAFRNVRRQMLAAAQGSTDFGQLFLAMGFFLVIAAAAMAGTLMRLLVEQRAAQIGLLLASGWPRKKVSRLFLAEGLVLALQGAILGVALGILYQYGILQALNHWWMSPWGKPVLKAHLTLETLLIGAGSGLVLGILCVLWGVRTAGKKSLLRLLSGRQALAMIPPGKGRLARITTLLLLALSATMIIAAHRKSIPSEMGFFCGGAALLAALLTAAAAILRACLTRRADVISLPALALRNAAANRRRSLLTLGLLACASFLLVSVAANRRDYSTLDTSDPHSGAGGFILRATTSLPLHYDLATPEARKNLGFTASEEQAFAGVQSVSLTESPGDDISCLNLAQPQRPRLLGVTPVLQSLPVEWLNPNEKSPWTQFTTPPDQAGTIPAIGDADSLQWILHTDLGQTYSFTGSDNQPIKLRIVGLIHGSIFAGALLVSEPNLRRIYPHLSGRNYFLFRMPADVAQPTALADTLRSALADEGVEVRTTREILNRYVRVQNVYLSIFLSLGGLGLLLGTAGLVAVIARNVLERRGELALMAATGFQRPRLVRLITLEHAGLLAAGLLCGAAAALIVIYPILHSGQADIPWQTLATLLIAVAAVGLVACILTARNSLGKNPLRALREE